MNINIKRVYTPWNPEDGTRILVDRLWPRGIKKEDAHIIAWMKDIAPSNELRKWFHHDYNNWNEFKEKYFNELEMKKDLCHQLIAYAENNLTLVYGSKNEMYNQAVVLKEFLEANIKNI